jgi:hypothetical protein
MDMKIKIEESIRLTGKFTLRAWPKGIIPKMMARGMSYRVVIGRLPRSLVKARLEVDNLVVTIGKQLFGEWAIGNAPTAFTYHAIGTGTAAPSVSDVKLETEESRVVLASRTRSGNIVTLSAFYISENCTLHIKEVGIFGGNASATPDSGTLLSRALLEYDNSAGIYDLTFDYSLTIG